MTPKIHVALALADTLLACEATQITFVNSAQWALGKKWRWIPAVCRAILTQTQDLPHQHSRTVLANIILKHTGYNAAWEGNSPAPQIQHYCLNPALLSTAPAWVVALALPQLNNTNELAQWLEISPEKLTWYADQWRDNFHSDTALQHYHYRWLEKKNGGWRLLEIPKIHLRALQKTILHKLLYLVPPHQAAHGFRRAHSCVTHAVLHTKQRIVIRMDLKDFFSSISAAKVHAVFKTIGYPSKVASLLARICSHRTPNQELTEHMRIRHRLSWQERQILRTRHLPQGSPSSPALANLCAYRLDLRLQALAVSLNACYSRYADDLVFSGGHELEQAMQRVHVQVATIVLEEGFLLNTRKTRMMRASTRQRITGIVVNQHPNFARKDFDNLKAELSNCIRHGPTSQNRDARANYQQFLSGKVAYVSMLNPQRGARLRQLFEKIVWMHQV